MTERLSYVIVLLIVHWPIRGMRRGLGIDEVLSINEFAIGDTMPDLTVFFDIDPEVGLARIAAE